MSRTAVFAAPADVELAGDPLCPDWIIEGRPQARSKCLARSADGACTVVAWSCTAGRFTWHYSVDETLHIVSGEVFVTDENGKVHRLGPGDLAYFPAGSRSVWHVPVEVTKLAVCRQAMPRPFGWILRMWNRLANRLARCFADQSLLGERPVTRAEGTPVSAWAACGVIDKPSAHP